MQFFFRRYWRLGDIFHVTCGSCGHHNRPARTSHEGIRLALVDQLPPCRRCGTVLRCRTLPDRPMVREAATAYGLELGVVGAVGRDRFVALQRNGNGRAGVSATAPR